MTRLATALALAAALGCSAASDPSASAEPAAAFDLERLRGGRVTLDDLRGRFVLLDFWATWCAPCVLEIPELNAFYEQVRDDGVELLAIAVDGESPEQLGAWADENGIAYPVALGDEEVARRYGANAFPFHVLISPEGHVLERLDPGYHDRQELLALLARHR